MAFLSEREQPAIVVRVNFGLFAGRKATAAELDRLAEWLLDEVGEVEIIAEERHEIDSEGEASVHQVLIQIESADGDRDALAQRILERTEHWARICVNERHLEIAEEL
jgi:hypothetical protein